MSDLAHGIDERRRPSSEWVDWTGHRRRAQRDSWCRRWMAKISSRTREQCVRDSPNASSIQSHWFAKCQDCR